MPRIVMTVRPGGAVTIEGEGYQGPACDLELQRLAAAVGAVRATRKKPEYYQAAVAKPKTAKVGR